MQFGIDSIVPDDTDKEFIHSTIFKELTGGIFKDETKIKFLAIIEKLRLAGADGVVFSCTEFSILINPSDCNIPIFDTAFIHSKAATESALTE